jgi:hypothetical protein
VCEGGKAAATALLPLLGRLASSLGVIAGPARLLGRLYRDRIPGRAFLNFDPN